MTPGILSAVRAGCAWVAGTAEHVRINGDPDSYARSFNPALLTRPEWDTQHHFEGTEGDTVAYVLALDAVNFGSGWFTHLRTEPGISGYFTIASRLAERFRRGGPLDAMELSVMDAGRASDLFGQPLDDPMCAELMDHFAEAWRQLGALLLGRYGGSPTRLVESAGGRAEALVKILADMPYYRDVATYRGRAVPLYKRAQITASDLALALDGRGLGAFDDLDRLTIFADDLVPHVLRMDGLIAYDQTLRGRIDRGELLAPGSAEEVEIRAVAVHAAELVVAELRRAGAAVTARDLDVALWNRGQAPRFSERPRHRTRTTYY